MFIYDKILQIFRCYLESHTMSNEEVLQKLKNAFSELDNVPDSKILAKLNSEQGEENLEDTRILEMTLAKCNFNF